MKKLLVCMAVMTVLLKIGPMAQAATFDATGDWTVWTLPGQFILDTIEIPVAEIGVGITQASDDTFSFESDPIPEMGDITYSGSGIVDNQEYLFDETLEETFNLQEFDSTFPNLDVTLALAGFFLESSKFLSGHFDLSTVIMGTFVDLGDVQFEGAMNPVPIPGAFLLLGSGLIGLAGFRRGLFKT
jgi:hypothetical protein